MPKIIVIAFDISYRDLPNLHLFLYKSFEEQLKEIENRIREVCEILTREEKNANQWVISWREYGLYNGFHDRNITSTQKSLLKNTLSNLTKDYPKLTIIGGTVATKQDIDSQDLEKLDRKKKGLEQAYNENIHLINLDDSNEFKNSRRAAQDVQKVSVQNFSIIRNTAYVFSNGTCIARHDKTIPFNEIRNCSTSTIFRPGKGQSNSSYINENMSIEICREHELGLFAREVQISASLKSQLSLIQFVLSDSIYFIPKNMVSPYAIYIDSQNQNRLITDIDKENIDVSLYSYNILSKTSNLIRVEPQSVRSFLISFIEECMKKSTFNPLKIDRIVKDKLGNDLLNEDDYVKLTILAAKKYIHAESFDTFRVEKILRDLLLKVASNKTIFLEKEIAEDVLKKAITNKDHETATILLEKYQSSMDQSFINNLKLDADFRIYLTVSSANDNVKKFLRHH